MTKFKCEKEKRINGLMGELPLFGKEGAGEIFQCLCPFNSIISAFHNSRIRFGFWHLNFKQGAKCSDWAR